MSSEHIKNVRKYFLYTISCQDVYEAVSSTKIKYQKIKVYKKNIVSPELEDNP